MSASKSNLLKTGLILASLPLAVLAVKTVADLRRGAAGTPANIVVNVAAPQGSIPSSLWRNFAQGGEEPRDMIGPVAPKLKELKPEFIRLDHVFDFYKVDQGNGQFNFTELDKAINSVKATGATPMISLSYTPDSKEPADWNQWYSMVKATAHHYSVDLRLPNIYYEVWNEPDLFGGWHYGKSPNYSTLFIKTSQAVADGAAGSLYKVGGPATTSYYNNWIKSLFKVAATNRVRLDFISWHKYSKNPQDYLKDFEDFNNIIADYPQYFDIERLITETGPNPEPDSWYDTSDSGVHLMSLVTQLAGKIHRLFSFEVVDGPTPRSDKSPGWGIFTHSGTAKPRFEAIKFLNRLSGSRLASDGDGSWVTSISSQNSPTGYQTLIVNYDQNKNHTENPPLTYQNMVNGNYHLSFTYYPSRQSSSKNVVVSNNTLNLQNEPSLLLYPNSAVLVELSRI